MNLIELIAECSKTKRGNKEFALFWLAENEWVAEIGNSSPAVMLGEAKAEFRAEGPTAEEAVQNLITAIREEYESPPLEKEDKIAVAAADWQE